MCSRCLKALARGPVLILLIVLAIAAAGAAAMPLRICADPDNLPFSNRESRGFDNRIAQMVARAAGRDAAFVWARSRRGFLREQFNSGACDALMGVPEGMRGVLTTRPYFRSSYVFVTARREHLQIASFNDPHLNGRRIGLQVLEENYSPPSVPLIREGHAAQLVGFEPFGTHSGDIVRAVADGRVGTSVVWGPLAGYYSRNLPVQLTPVSPSVDLSGVPFAFSMTIAVHKRDTALRDALNTALKRVQPQIERILAEYGVPEIPLQEEAR